MDINEEKYEVTSFDKWGRILRKSIQNLTRESAEELRNEGYRVRNK